MFLTQYVGVLYICYVKKSAKESPDSKKQDFFNLLFFFLQNYYVSPE
jgi:hypothetical protein